MMKYYVITNKLFNDSNFGFGEHRNVDYNTGNAKYCNECGNPISMLEWLPPFEISISKMKLGDFVFGTYVGFVVSENFKVKFEKNNLKGLTNFREVKLYYRNRELPVKYYYPEITLLKAFIDISKVKYEEKNLCVVCQKGDSIMKLIDGIFFINPEEINEDIFFTSAIGQSTIILSQAFKDFSDKNEFTNLNLVQTSDYKWDSLSPW